MNVRPPYLYDSHVDDKPPHAKEPWIQSKQEF